MDADAIVAALMDVAWGQGCTKIILRQTDLPPSFFDLKTRMAGEVLQKATNYRIQLAIVGDFTQIASESLRAFITESNRGRQVCFVADVATARQRLASL